MCSSGEPARPVALAELESAISEPLPRAPHLPGARNQWQILPTEVHLHIMKHLDPVSQMCLGLTSRQFHRLFHSIMNEYDDHEDNGEGAYKIKKYPFSLDMRASKCGECMVNWWWDDEGSLNDDDIQWARSLGELVSGENTLFGDLKQCCYCLKYKPSTAYYAFGFEVNAYAQGGEFWEVDEEMMEWYWEKCRRCRARELMVHLEKRTEVFDERSGASLGLRTETGTHVLVRKALTSQSYGSRRCKNPVRGLVDRQSLANLTEIGLEPCGGGKCQSWEPCVGKDCKDPVRKSDPEKVMASQHCLATGSAIPRDYTKWEDIFTELGI